MKSKFKTFTPRVDIKRRLVMTRFYAGVNKSNSFCYMIHRITKKGKIDKGFVNSALSDLLRVLLKSCSESTGVASKLIASAGDLDALAAGDRSIAALSGWRYEVFGQSALELCDGKIGLSVRGTKVKTFQL